MNMCIMLKIVFAVVIEEVSRTGCWKQFMYLKQFLVISQFRKKLGRPGRVEGSTPPIKIGSYLCGLPPCPSGDFITSPLPHPFAPPSPINVKTMTLLQSHQANLFARLFTCPPDQTNSPRLHRYTNEHQQESDQQLGKCNRAHNQGIKVQITTKDTNPLSAIVVLILKSKEQFLYEGNTGTKWVKKEGRLCMKHPASEAQFAKVVFQFQPPDFWC